MTYNNYLADCLDFSKASAIWSELDPRKPYITTNGSGWQESCDNNNGGIDVSWAFHRSSPTSVRMPRSTSLTPSQNSFSSPSTTMTVTPTSCKPSLIYSFEMSYLCRIRQHYQRCFEHINRFKSC